MFEFVKRNKRPRLLWLVILAAIVSSVYFAVFALVEQNYTYLVFQAVFMLAFGLIMVVNSAVARRQERKARRVFARLVAEMNKCYVRGETTQDTVKELKKLNKHYVNDEIVGRASELLHSKGLETNRSVDQQRKLNNALNGLLQAYARNSARTKA